MDKQFFHYNEVMWHLNELKRLGENVTELIDLVGYNSRQIAIDESDNFKELEANLAKTQKILRCMASENLIHTIDEIKKSGGSNTHKHNKPLMTTALKMEQGYE